MCRDSAAGIGWCQAIGPGKGGQPQAVCCWESCRSAQGRCRSSGSEVSGTQVGQGQSLKYKGQSNWSPPLRHVALSEGQVQVLRLTQSRHLSASVCGRRLPRVSRQGHCAQRTGVDAAEAWPRSGCGNLPGPGLGGDQGEDRHDTDVSRDDRRRGCVEAFLSVIAHALPPGRCRRTAQESCLSVMSSVVETSLREISPLLSVGRNDRGVLGPSVMSSVVETSLGEISPLPSVGRNDRGWRSVEMTEGAVSRNDGRAVGLLSCRSVPFESLTAGSGRCRSSGSEVSGTQVGQGQSLKYKGQSNWSPPLRHVALSEGQVPSDGSRVFQRCMITFRTLEPSDP
jgi:hypothetical protein